MPMDVVLAGGETLQAERRRFAKFKAFAPKLAPLSYKSLVCMEQIANGGHSSSSQHFLYSLQNSNNKNNNDNSLNAMEMSVLDRQRERFNALNWTSPEQVNGPFNSSEMFSDGVMTTGWQQFAAQNGHLLMANRGDVAMFGVKNQLNLQNGWPNLANNLNSAGLVKNGEENNSGMTATFDSDSSCAERAAKFSSFNDSEQMLTYQKASVDKMVHNASEVTACSNDSESGKLICRTASAEKVTEKLTAVAEESEKLSAGNGNFSTENAGRKRKNDRTRAQEMKAADSEESKEKRTKSVDSCVKEKENLRKRKTEQSNSDNSVESSPKSVKENSKVSEGQKQDYIHVRARRGQATDSHSLAERVRREKISERMKYLQDLVPGCNKVTGKAVMLDEIINYVQSLQRQVEFLSMKLAAVNPRLELNVDNFFAKEMMAPCVNFTSLGGMSPDLAPYLQFPQMQQQQASLHAGVCSGFDIPSIVSSDATSLHRTANVPVSAELFVDANFQGHPPSAWDTELQNVFSAGLVQGRQPPFASQGLPGHLDINHMKMEL